MHPADSTPLVPSVKLFPRLATSRRSHRPSRIIRGLHKATDPADDLRSQVRARLLRMILDNEQVRRNEQRPSAS